MPADNSLTRQAFLLTPLAACASEPDDIAAGAWIEQFIDLFYRRKQVRAAFERYVVEDYIQHSEGIGQGREAAIAVLSPMFARPRFQLDPVRVVRDGALAIVFVRVTLGADASALVIDIFRTAQGRIVEHWDLKRDIPVSDADIFFANLA